MATASPSAVQMLSYLIALITLEMSILIPDLLTSKLRLKDTKKTLEKHARCGETGQRDDFLIFFFIQLCISPFLLVTKQMHLFSDLVIVRGGSFPSSYSLFN